MAKTNYLELTNRILRRINQTDIANVAAATGHALIITNLLNEAQNELFTETNWYSLYTMRTFNTVTYTASTISFANSNPDTIDDSASGFGSFEANMEVLVSGSTSNDGVYKVATAAAGSLTLQTSDSLTVEAAGSSITITAISYPFASDHGRTLDMMDATNNIVLSENTTRIFDLDDPDGTLTGNPLAFTDQGDTFRLHPIPAGTYKIRERYWKVPTTLSANADTSDLPIEAENALIHAAWFKILEYLNKFELADRTRIAFERIKEKAISANKKKIDNMRVINPLNMRDSRFGIEPVRFPSSYPAGRY